MERTGGFEPPFSAPFTSHRFEAGVGYVRTENWWRTGVTLPAWPACKASLSPCSFPAMVQVKLVAGPGVAPGSTRLMRPRGSLTDLPA